MPVIIDGHNLLWAIREITEDRDVMSERQLCYVLGRYLSLIQETGEIVFDGAGPTDKSIFGNHTNLDVFFAGASSDTDTVIEQMIKASSAPGRLMVVSTDRRLRRAASARKAASVKSEAFWAEVQRQLSKKPGRKEPRAKRDGLSESETDQWLDLFGLGQQ